MNVDKEAYNKFLKFDWYPYGGQSFRFDDGYSTGKLWKLVEKSKPFGFSETVTYILEVNHRSERVVYLRNNIVQPDLEWLYNEVLQRHKDKQYSQQQEAEAEFAEYLNSL